MSRTIKQKSNKEYTPFLCFSKHHIAMERNNKRREFLNCFCDNAADELISYEEDFEIKQIYVKNRNLHKSGTALVYQKKIVAVTIEKEIEAREDEILDENTLFDLFDEHDNYLCHYLENGEVPFELRMFYRYEYIKDSVFEHYFGKNINKHNTPYWAIFARLAGVTPPIIARVAGISKKLAREIYSQFEYNWTDINPRRLGYLYGAFRDSLPDALYRIQSFAKCNPENIRNLWKNRRGDFFKREIIREAGQVYELPSNLDRIEYTLNNLYLSDMKIPHFTSVKKMVDYFESLLCEDREFFDFSKIECDFPYIKQITSNPREIFKIGNKYGNCLRQKALMWNNSAGFIVETNDGCVFQVVVGFNGTLSLIDAKRKFNNAPNETDQKHVEFFIEMNNMFINHNNQEEIHDEDPGF